MSVVKTVVFSAFLSLPVVALAKPAPTIVTIDAGQIQGSADGGVVSWKGIPFAQPPIGILRWRAPQPAIPWSVIRTTADYGHDCMQVPLAIDAAPLGTPPAEDCLYLNVWRPAKAQGHLPVVVWIYGGGFVNGGSSPPTYSGASLTAQGVIFVSFNYRLGRFGTFAHPQLTKEDPDQGLLGNYGYLDQLAALHWVQRNIAAFGGDVSNITVMGESAGGMSVLNLLTSPLAKGLFAKAVVMSGGDGKTPDSVTLQSTEKVGVDFAQSKGIAPDDSQALEKLRALSAEDVTSGLTMMALLHGTQPRTFSSPFADGTIAVDAAGAIKSGAFAHVPIIIGATGGDMGGDTGVMIAGARGLARMLSQQGVPVYEYRFSYIADPLRRSGRLKAFHATDIPFFFDTQDVKYGSQTTPLDDQVGKTISAYIVRFVKSGSPNGQGLPAWRKYDSAQDKLMDFSAGGSATPEIDPLSAKIDAAP